MLQLSPQSRIFLATQPVDFRKGIDALAAGCRQVLGQQPLGGAVFVFRNRSATASPPSRFSRRAVPRPSHRETRASSASPLRRHLSRPRSAALCLAAGRWGKAAAGRWGGGSHRQRGGRRA